MADRSDPRGQAEARFAKAQTAANERKKAMAAHDADAKAVEAKTARLRALRLAKEAAEAEGGVDPTRKK